MWVFKSRFFSDYLHKATLKSIRKIQSQQPNGRKVKIKLKQGNSDDKITRKIYNITFQKKKIIFQFIFYLLLFLLLVSRVQCAAGLLKIHPPRRNYNAHSRSFSGPQSRGQLIIIYRRRNWYGFTFHLFFDRMAVFGDSLK